MTYWMTKLFSLNKNFFLAVLVSLLPIFFSYLLFPGFMGDDVFIHIGFVKGLINTGKFSFAGNITYGSTSPLWVILGFIFSKIFLYPEISIRILCALFTFFTIYIFYITLWDENINRGIFYVSLLSLAFNPFLLKWSISGMEATAAMTALLVVYKLNKRELSGSTSLLTGIVFGLSILLRPEFAAFFAIFLVYNYFFLSARRKQLLYTAFPCLVIIFAWLYYAHKQFGTIIPNTYVAKAGSGLIILDYQAFVRDIKVLIAGNLPEFFLLFILALYVTLFQIRNKNFNSILRSYFSFIKSNKVLIVLFWVLGFYIFYILKDVTIISRYSLILVPSIIIFTAVTFNFLSENFTAKTKKIFLVMYLISIVLSYGYLTFNIIVPSNNNFVRGFQRTYMYIASIIRNDSGGKNVSVAVSDIGVIGCYSGARIDDLGGLVDRSRFNYNSPKEYVSYKKPDFIILRGEAKIDNILPENAGYKILYQKYVPGFSINDPTPRVVSLYKIIY